MIYGGDDRYIGNVFLAGNAAAAYRPTASGKPPVGYGTAGYDGHPGSLDEYLARVAAQPLLDLRREHQEARRLDDVALAIDDDVIAARLAPQRAPKAIQCARRRVARSSSSSSRTPSSLEAAT